MVGGGGFTKGLMGEGTMVEAVESFRAPIFRPCRDLVILHATHRLRGGLHYFIASRLVCRERYKTCRTRMSDPHDFRLRLGPSKEQKANGQSLTLSPPSSFVGSALPPCGPRLGRVS